MQLKDKTLFRQAALVGGSWVEADATNAIEVNDPASGEVIGVVPKLGAAETKAAIVAAERAQKEWAAHTAKERAGILRRWFELMMENQDDLGRILTYEQGKPLAEAKGNRLWRQLHRMVCGGSTQGLWRYRSRASAGQAHLGYEAADRRGRGDHTLELSERDDHP